MAQKVDFGNSSQAVHMVQFLPNGNYLIAGGFMKIWDINNPGTPAFRLFKKEWSLPLQWLLMPI